jgi:DNA (cytosine-5)-methyltransferase 1
MLTIAGLFAGIGGIEAGFHRALGTGVETALLCEWWGPAQTVLADRFPDVELHPDVRELGDLPAGLDVLAAGFPCTDLSQAGRTAGITGAQSGLVGHVFDVLRVLKKRRRRLPTLLIENVPNMLALDRGHAMAYLVGELESLGYRWAYRVVDSRFTGVPQRRRRVLLVASVSVDPRGVLFADEAGEPGPQRYGEDAYGFYWTEGHRGLGWAQDATPTLKGGSTIGIPSPPAVWLPSAVPGRKVIVPGVEDVEELQGFPRGWTSAAADGRRDGARWKLVGNAVTVGVAEWVAGRIARPGEPLTTGQRYDGVAWPTAAWGQRGRRYAVELSEYPLLASYRPLLSVVSAGEAMSLSHRAVAGFANRLERGNLGRHPGFRADIAEHIAITRMGTVIGVPEEVATA